MEARNRLASTDNIDHVGEEDDDAVSSLGRRDSGIVRRTAESGLSPPQADAAALERGSGTQLTSERPTLPPPTADVIVTHIHLRPSVDEILYRLSVGDEKGAFLAGLELEPLTPKVAAPRAVIRAMRLPYIEEYVLAFVDAFSTWGEILDGSPFAASETLGALCELVDKGVVTIA